MTRMQTEAQFAQTEARAREDGLTDAQIFALAIGCPVHGNAAMDWDDGEVFCYLTH